MLVLSRRIGQQIRIGTSIVVTVLKADRNKARIGIEAPVGIPVFRQELLDFDQTRSTKSAVDSDRPVFPSEMNRELRRMANPRFLWDRATV